MYLLEQFSELNEVSLGSMTLKKMGQARAGFITECGSCGKFGNRKSKKGSECPKTKILKRSEIKKCSGSEGFPVSLPVVDLRDSRSPSPVLHPAPSLKP